MYIRCMPRAYPLPLSAGHMCVYDAAASAISRDEVFVFDVNSLQGGIEVVTLMDMLQCHEIRHSSKSNAPSMIHQSAKKDYALL